jgi:hypothetical protein
LLDGDSQLDRVVRSVNQILFRAQVPFSRLDGGVPQKQLDLLKLAAGRSTQLRAGSAEVMWCDPGNSEFRRVFAQYLPDDLFA